MLRRARLNIVLVAPDIPGNTGCIGRTALANACALHLVHPLGFELSEKSLRRAGLDYWPRLDCREHASWDAFVDTQFGNVGGGDDGGNDGGDGRTPTPWLFTTHASANPHWTATFREGDYLIFGSESRGAPDAVHDWVRRRWGDRHRVSLPMEPDCRSINLAAAAAAAVYEARRQIAVSATGGG